MLSALLASGPPLTGPGKATLTGTMPYTLTVGQWKHVFGEIERFLGGSRVILPRMMTAAGPLLVKTDPVTVKRTAEFSDWMRSSQKLKT